MGPRPALQLVTIGMEECRRACIPGTVGEICPDIRGNPLLIGGLSTFKPPYTSLGLPGLAGNPGSPKECPETSLLSPTEYIDSCRAGVPGF